MADPAPRRERVLHWFRNDLRLRDNRALDAAAARAEQLALLFVFDERLVGGDGVGPPRLRFLLGCLERLASALAERGHRLIVRRGDPVHLVPQLARELRAERITWNEDHGPYARRRDDGVRATAARLGIAVESHEDRVLFAPDRLRTGSGDPYRVYTPFRNAWWQCFDEDPPRPSGPLRLPDPVPGIAGGPIPSAEAWGLGDDRTELPTPGEAAAQRRLDTFLGGAVARYAEERDRPDLDGTSRLSPYLRLGVLSPRLCFERALEREREDREARRGVRSEARRGVRSEARRGVRSEARRGVRKWLDELIWREFYVAILAAHPHVVCHAFRPEYDALSWEEDEAGFRAWCEGRTGFPFVDAAMRQLAATGWMHNRARMVVASFLTKDLGIDWRCGERFFQARLVDGDLASNNGGWQWAASTGTDAQPWFRVFNPVAQGERHDPDGGYVRRWVPELRELDAAVVQRPWEASPPPRHYPRRMLDHAERRERSLRRFEAIRDAGSRGGAGSGSRTRRSRSRRGRQGAAKKRRDGETLALF